jgi:hypothetical protein
VSRRFLRPLLFWLACLLGTLALAACVVERVSFADSSADGESEGDDSELPDVEPEGELADAILPSLPTQGFVATPPLLRAATKHPPMIELAPRCPDGEVEPRPPCAA